MRGQGEGSVSRVPKDKTLPLRFWQVSVELPPDGGVRRRKTARSKDKPTALLMLSTMRQELERSGDLPTASMTTEAWFLYWLDRVAAKEIRPKTLGNYRSLIHTHVIPVIGKVRLDKLTPAHIRKVADRIIERRSSSTALSVHRIMSSSFADAEREGRIPRNPAKLTKAPRKTVPQLEVLTVGEAKHLVRTFGATPEGFLWFTFLLSCARRGEILGLTWDRVGDELDLSWQLQRFKVGGLSAPADYEFRQLTKGLYLTRPKSQAGTRVVPLNDLLRGVLGRWRDIAPSNPYGLVFASPNGEPLDPDGISKAWPNALRVAGIDKKVRLHDLRHTGVDMLYEAGVPETVIMELVGHSSRAVTRGYKSRGNRPQLNDAMQKMSELLT